MGGGLFCGCVYAAGFNYVFRAALVPGHVAGIHIVINGYLPAVYNKLSVALTNLADEYSVYGIELGHIGHILRADKRIVYANDLHILSLGAYTQNKPANTPKAVNSNLY